MGLGDALGALRRRMREERERDPQLFRLRVVLGVVLAILFVIVVSGDPSEGVPERLGEGKTVRAVDYWRTYGWWVALGNCALLGVLIATARRWFVRGTVTDSPELAPPRRPGPLFALLVLAAVFAGGSLAAQRIDQSFWHDEAYNVSRSIDGSYVVDDSGAVRFHPVRWRDTLWFYHYPNNHVAHTVLARISLHTWQALTSPETHFASEPVVRLPAFLAGLASIASLALLWHRLGYAGVGVFAAWLMALHPWHIKYTSEARGYTMMFLFLTASLTLLVRALYRGTWGRWALFGVAQFLLLWTYVGVVFHVIVVNLVALAALWHLYGRTPDLAPQATRWAAANLFGAMLWIQLMVPNLAQLPAYMEKTGGIRDVGGRFVGAMLSYLYSGMPWSHGRLGLDPVYPELADVVARAPTAVWALLAVALVTMAAGVARLLAAGGVRALLVGVLVLPGPITYGVGALQRANLHVWYLLFVLPSMAALIALGLFWLVPRRLGSRSAGALMGALALSFLGAHLWLTQPARSALLSRSFSPQRESVLLARPNPDPQAPENERILTAHWRNAIYYDPRLLSVERPDELEQLMRRADAEDLELYVNHMRRRSIEKERPSLLALIEDESRFERLAVLHAFEPPWTRYVYRYRRNAEPGPGQPTARVRNP